MVGTRYALELNRGDTNDKMVECTYIIMPEPKKCHGDRPLTKKLKLSWQLEG